MRFNGLKSPAGTRSLRSSSRLGRAAEILLMLILAVQVARLFWVLVSPPGVFGDWRAFEPAVPGAQARAVIFSSFDPFYRQAPAAGDAVQQVTSLPFKLYGIRINEGSGQGTAIIADETGKQSSFATGQEIAPGITLKAVSYDHVLLSRNGADEMLYIDQSGSAPLANPTVPAPPAGPGNVAPVSGDVPSPQALAGAISLTPRMENGAITGVVIAPQGNGDAFARAGFHPGDVVEQVNGSPVRSAQDIAALRSAIRPGARLTLMVVRGSATVPLALVIPDNK